MQKYTGVTSESTHLNLNRAIEWRKVGRAAAPHAGTIVVYPHHVAKITQELGRGVYMMVSGNDGHAVRERPRTLRGAVALREL